MRDITLGETVDFKFTTCEPDTGAPATLSGTPVISAYVGNSTTQITAGITLSVDFDGVTGLNNVRVAATSGNGYTDNSDVALIITTGTVDSVSAVGYKVAEFTIGRAASYTRLGAPAAASVSADILAIDNLVDDLESRIGTPSNLGGGATIAANLSDIESQTDDIGVAGAGLTALASAANLATVAGYLDTEIAAILADTNELQTDWANGGRLDLILDARASQTSVDTVDGIVDDIKQMLGHKTTIATLASQTSFTLTAGSADNDAYNGWGAFVVDASTATQVCLGVVSDYTGSTRTITLRESPGIFTMATGDHVILLPGKLTDGVNVTQIEGVDATDQLDAHAAAGLDAAGVRAALGLASANLDTQLSALQSDTNDIQTRLPAALVSGRMDASVGAMAANVMTAAAAASDLTTELQSGLATASAVSTLQTTATTIAGYLDTEVAAIKAVTDKLDTAMELDSTVYRFTSNALENAPVGEGGGAGDWTTGEKEQIRHRLGIDGDSDEPAATPSLATAAAVAAIESALPADPADASDIATAFAGVNTKLDTIDDLLDTEVAAIKAKTDQLTFDDSNKVHASVKQVGTTVLQSGGTGGQGYGA